MYLVCCLSKIMYKYTPMWALNEGRSGCGYSLWNIPPEIKWTRVEGIQKQVLWIEVCFLQTRLAIFCVPLPSVHSFSLSPNPSRALLSRGKVSRVKSVSRGSTGDAKLTRKTVQKALHSCCEVAPWAQCHKLHFLSIFTGLEEGAVRPQGLYLQKYVSTTLQRVLDMREATVSSFLASCASLWCVGNRLFCQLSPICDGSFQS